MFATAAAADLEQETDSQNRGLNQNLLLGELAQAAASESFAVTAFNRRRWTLRAQPPGSDSLGQGAKRLAMFELKAGESGAHSHDERDVYSVISSGRKPPLTRRRRAT